MERDDREELLEERDELRLLYELERDDRERLQTNIHFIANCWKVWNWSAEYRASFYESKSLVTSNKKQNLVTLVENNDICKLILKSRTSLDL